MRESSRLPDYPLHMLLRPNHAAVPEWWPDRPARPWIGTEEIEPTPPPGEAEQQPPRD